MPVTSLNDISVLSVTLVTHLSLYVGRSYCISFVIFVFSPFGVTIYTSVSFVTHLGVCFSVRGWHMSNPQHLPTYVGGAFCSHIYRTRHFVQLFSSLPRPMFRPFTVVPTTLIVYNVGSAPPPASLRRPFFHGACAVCACAALTIYTYMRTHIATLYTSPLWITIISHQLLFDTLHLLCINYLH